MGRELVDGHSTTSLGWQEAGDWVSKSRAPKHSCQGSTGRLRGDVICAPGKLAGGGDKAKLTR